MKNELRERRMKKFFALRAKTYNYLADDSDEKKGKARKECIIKKHSNLKIIKILYKNKIDVKSFIENHKDFIINNRLILK